MNASSYDHYKTLVDAWSDYTDAPKVKHGLAVALSLEGCGNNICEKLFTENGSLKKHVKFRKQRAPETGSETDLGALVAADRQDFSQ